VAATPKVQKVVHMLRRELRSSHLPERMVLYGAPLRDILEELSPAEKEQLFLWVADKFRGAGKQEGRSQGFLQELDTLAALGRKPGVERTQMKDKTDEELVGINKNAPVITVLHSNLTRVNEESNYRSDCPKCKRGVLLVSRDQKTFELLATDRCILCGQQVIYSDIEELRGLLG